VALSALKKAVSQKKVKLGKLYDMAKKNESRTSYTIIHRGAFTMNDERAKHIRRRLKQLSAEDSSYHINKLRVIVALERAIARIEQHKELSNHIIFKGGFVLLKIAGSQRFTRDADALAVNIDKERLKVSVYKASLKLKSKKDVKKGQPVDSMILNTDN